MTTLLQIAGLAAILVLIVFILKAFKTLENINKLADKSTDSLDKLTKDIGEFKTRAIATLDEVSVIKGKIAEVLDDVSELKEKTVESLENFDALANRVERSTSMIESKIEAAFSILRPLESLLGFVSNKLEAPISTSKSFFGAASKAFSAFKDKLSHR